MSFDIAVSFAGQLFGENEKISGDNYSTFTVSVSERVYNKTTKTSDYKTNYIDVRVFGKTVDYVRKIAKGTPVFVSGTLDGLRSYESKGVEKIGISVLGNLFNKGPKDFSDSEPASGSTDKVSDEYVDDEEEEEEAAPVVRRVRTAPTARVNA